MPACFEPIELVVVNSLVFISVFIRDKETYGVLSCYDNPDAPRMSLNCADTSRKPFSRSFDYHLDRFKKQC